MAEIDYLKLDENNDIWVVFLSKFTLDGERARADAKYWDRKLGRMSDKMVLELSRATAMEILRVVNECFKARVKKGFWKSLWQDPEYITDHVEAQLLIRLRSRVSYRPDGSQLYDHSVFLEHCLRKDLEFQ